MDVSRHPVDIAAYAAGSSEAALAAALDISAQAVSNWRSRGIPVDRCVEIFRLYRVPLWELRPQDWHVHWPMLVGTQGAPAPDLRKND